MKHHGQPIASSPCPDRQPHPAVPHPGDPETEEVAPWSRRRLLRTFRHGDGQPDVWARLSSTYEIGRVSGYRFAWAPARDPLTGEKYAFVEHASEELLADQRLVRRMARRLGRRNLRILCRGPAPTSAAVAVRCHYLSRSAGRSGALPGIEIADPRDPVLRRYVVERLAAALSVGYAPFDDLPAPDEVHSRVGALLAGDAHRSLVALDEAGHPAGHVTWTAGEDLVLGLEYVDILDTWTEEAWQGRNLTETLIDAAAAAAGRRLVVGNVSWEPGAAAVMKRLIRRGWEPFARVAEHTSA